MNDTKRIYIADDESNIRNLIKAFLVKAGFDVSDFENGDLLLSAFSEEPADLVILDVMMPGSSGFVICKELRRKSTVPIIMLTARDSDLDYATGLELGSDDYLLKPFSPMALVKRIEATFRRVDFERGTHSENDFAENNSLEAQKNTHDMNIFVTDISRLISNMGGNIWVESETGNNTTFAFTLPFNKNNRQNADESENNRDECTNTLALL